MTVNGIPPRQPDHECDLPYSHGGYGSTGFVDGYLIQCALPNCGRWWVSSPGGAHYGPVSIWRPVRWYRFILRRRIRRATGLRDYRGGHIWVSDTHSGRPVPKPAEPEHDER